MELRPFKRIKELEEMISQLESDNQSLRDKARRIEEENKKENKGLHTPNALCVGCKNLVTMPSSYTYHQN